MSISRKSSKSELGRLGERFAAQYLQRTLGWSILHQNWRCTRGEIDLIAIDGNEVVICEVRTRHAADQFQALESVAGKKLLRLQELTKWYMYSVNTINSYGHLSAAVRGAIDHELVRIDVVALACQRNSIKQVSHIRNASQS